MFDRLTISRRIAASLAITLALVLLVGTTGIWTANRMGSSVDELHHLDEVATVIEHARSASVAYTLDPSQERSNLASQRLKALDTALGAANETLLLDKSRGMSEQFSRLTAMDQQVEQSLMAIDATLDGAVTAAQSSIERMDALAVELDADVERLNADTFDAERRAIPLGALSRALLVFQRDVNRFAATSEDKDLNALQVSERLLNESTTSVVSDIGGDEASKKSYEKLAKMKEVTSGVLAQWIELRDTAGSPPARIAAAEVRILRGASAMAKLTDQLSKAQQQVAHKAKAEAAGLKQAIAAIQNDTRELRDLATAVLQLSLKTTLYARQRDDDIAQTLEEKAKGLLTRAAKLQDPEARVALNGLDHFLTKIAETRTAFAARRATSSNLNAITTELSDHFEESANKVNAAIESTRHLSVIAMAATVAAAMILGIAVGWRIARSIRRQIRSICHEMQCLIDGQYDRPLPSFARNTEPGEMSAALEIFQNNARRIDALAVEKETNDQAAIAARVKMMDEIRQAFGAVVDRAIAGDFSARVPTNYADDALNQLAVSVNRLLETVDHGIAETGRVIGHMAKGDLTKTMNGKFDGAFADLQTAVNATIDHVARLVGELQTAAESMREGTDGIAKSATDLSSRTKSQACTLQKTATSMEEVRSTIRSNSESAEQARSLSIEASNRAARGNEVTRQAIAAVSRIEESSAHIADIVSMIDEIAFQTNLLALNASVEAARAGEAGKGFAVVASEVRTLAQRSAEASKDIKGHISMSAVQVSEGSTLVARAGSALNEIVESAQNVTNIVGEIATASQEQAVSVGAISSSVRDMDSMTQKNAAMAGESASTAQCLAEESAHLFELVSFFRINHPKTTSIVAASA